MILPLGKTRSRLAFDVPNAKAKGRGRTKLGETGQSITPRPLERRVAMKVRITSLGGMLSVGCRMVLSSSGASIRIDMDVELTLALSRTMGGGL